MVATVNVQEYNGASPGVATVITQGRYCTMDSYNPGLSNPCVVPSAGLNYSYWKTHNVAFSGDFTQISNIRWYTSGNVKTNCNKCQSKTKRKIKTTKTNTTLIMI